MGRFARSASGARRAWAEPLEGRIFLSTVSPVVQAEPAVSAPVVIQSETYTVELPINALVAAGRATVTATPFDIGSIANIFDGDNSTLYRSANINPAVIEVSF